MSAQTIDFLEKIVLPIVVAIIGLFGGIAINKYIKKNKTINKNDNSTKTKIENNGTQCDVAGTSLDKSINTNNYFYGTFEPVKEKNNAINEQKLAEKYAKYSEIAYKSHNDVKTLVSRDTLRHIKGVDSIYVSVGVNHEKLGEFSTEHVVKLFLNLGNHIVIQGTTGAGKTMLMKYLFLEAVEEESYIPLFIRLNRISEQQADNISIKELVYLSIGEFCDDVSVTEFKYNLDKGKYLFLFDGFDEIAETHLKKASIAINDFCKKYPDNPCVVTSRAGMDMSQFLHFESVQMMPLNKEQAIELASKLGMDDEKTKEFCKQLDKGVFYKHREFAENPLLLSMMFLTFLENGSVPERIVDFYDRAYNALYNNHDSFKYGYFERTFESSLTPDEFKKVFSHFCFQTYMAAKYYFTKDEITEQIKKSMAKCELDESQAENYLNDLIKAVCLFTCEGTSYVFTYGCFQAYFAALYTEKMDDEKQGEFFEKLLSKERYSTKEDYYKILSQLMNEQFYINALEDKFRSIGLNNSITEEKILRLVKCGNLVTDYIDFYIKAFFEEIYFCNCFNLFKHYKRVDLYYDEYTRFTNKKNKERFKELFEKAPKGDFDNVWSFDLENSDELTDLEKQEFYLIVIKETGFDKFLLEIHNWLNSLDEKRKKLKESSKSQNWFEEF
ncbi:MAG: NACHT domain-containing protein [Clostridia bacterium]|nr:NACHT domain-containing protein [Clostridia bacterium]